MKINNSSKLHPAYAMFFKVIVYAIFVTISAFIIKKDAGLIIDGSKFGETSMTELLQELYLFLTALIFFISGYRNQNYRSIAYLMCGGAMLALIREFDFYFDKIYHGVWFPFAIIFLLLTLFIVYRYRHQLSDNFKEFCSTPACGIFISGLLSVLIFSRLFGTKKVWRALFNVDSLDVMQRWVKNAVEEGSELFGYTLLFISAIEFFIYLSQKKKQIS